MKIILLSIILYSNIIFAQPYIYFPKDVEGENYFYRKIQRFNIKTNQIEDFPKRFEITLNTQAIWSPDQSYLTVNYDNSHFLIINCNDTSQYFEHFNSLDESEVYEILFSSNSNKLYVFSENYELELSNLLSILDLDNGQIIGNVISMKHVGYHNLMYPIRNSFFSADGNKIFLYSKDPQSNDEQVWTYSLSSGQIIQNRNLSELGFSNSDGYGLTFGKNGNGIIESYTNYNNPVKNFYYNLYDFDNNISSPFIYHNGLAEAYFNGNGEFILIMDTHLDDSLRYYHTGVGKIYNSETGQLLKIINVPAGGIIYTFDNYPNDIYYVKNIETQPEIYNLTKLKLNTITPGLSLPYTSGLAITVKGSLFTSSTQAYFNNQPRSTTYLTDTTLSIQLNAGDLSTAGNYPIWISNYGSNSDTLTYSVVSSLPQPITPLVECVKNNGGGSYTAKFGYRNDNTKSVFVPVGTNNKFSPTPENGGQPTIFLPGINYEVFSVNFNGKNLVWNIFNKKVTASKNSTPCP